MSNPFQNPEEKKLRNFVPETDLLEGAPKTVCLVAVLLTVYNPKSEMKSFQELIRRSPTGIHKRRMEQNGFVLRPKNEQK